MDSTANGPPPPEDIRFALRLQDGSRALVRQLTARGMYVETRARLGVGESLALELRPVDSGLRFTAEGVVVAVHAGHAAAGVQVRFTSIRMSAA